MVEIQRILNENQRLFDFWNQFLNTSLPKISFEEDIYQKLISLRDEAIKLIEKKSNSPLDVVTISDELGTALKDIEGIQKTVMTYNLEISTINDSIESQKSSIVSGNIEGAKSDLILLQSTKLGMNPIHRKPVECMPTLWVSRPIWRKKQK